MKIVSGSKSLDLHYRTAVVAIINVTPDSYVDGGKYTGKQALMKRVQQCIEEGADILEIGGESTGPDSLDVSVEEEVQRVIPVVEAIRAAFPDVWIAVDTTKAIVAKNALLACADMINDVSAGRQDPDMFSIIEKARCPYVMMYAKDPTPRTQKEEKQYDDVVQTIKQFLTERIAAAVAAGIDDSSIIIDPGLGHFVSSDPKYSYEIIRRLAEFSDLGPVFLSPSRKSFLAGPKNLPVAERLPATIAATVLAVEHGARFIRTHDVKETVEALTVVQQMY